MSLLDQSIALGPIGLSVARWLLILAVLVALLVGALIGARRRVAVSDTLISAMLFGLVSARLLFVVRYHDRYDGVLAMLDIRDGGFATLGGLVVATAYLAWRFWRTPRHRSALGGAVLAGGLVWTGLTGSLWMMDETSRPLPDLTMTTLEGQPTSLPALADEHGLPLVVNLWASWCPPCRREMPVLDEAQQQHPDIDFVFVNQGESAAQVQRFLDAEQLRHLANVWLDDNQRLGQVTGAQVMPTTLFYDTEGQLVDTHFGELSRASLAPYLERIGAH
ncbi:prolipoprotein diacylglyceryl transferase family protein [Halomonas cupida]|uniref:TlpA family protein disulfide reductase n=1 Tax=Halomonas cupida TaxID=44933 RepID=UPI003EF3D02D